MTKARAAQTALTMKLTDIPVTDLREFPGNPRRGDVDAMAASLQRNSQYRPIVVNRGDITGRPMEILSGNHTWHAARDIGLETLKCIVIDVDEQAAKRIVLADNRLPQLGHYNQTELDELLRPLTDLEGTGYTELFADVLREHTAPKPNMVESAHSIRIGLLEVMIPEEDWATLDEAMDSYSATHGNLFGFVGALVQAAETR